MLWVFIKVMFWLVCWSLCPPEGLLGFTEFPHLFTYFSAAVPWVQWFCIVCFWRYCQERLKFLKLCPSWRSEVLVLVPACSHCSYSSWVYIFSFRSMVSNYLAGFLWEINMVLGMKSDQWRQWQPTPVLLPGKFRGRRSLVDCSPWGREESDTTEQRHFHFSLSCTGEGNDNPLQCSCLENPRDGGAWWAAIYGVAQSRTRLKWLSSSSSMKSGQLSYASWELHRCWLLSCIWNKHGDTLEILVFMCPLP